MDDLRLGLCGSKSINGDALVLPASDELPTSKKKTKDSKILTSDWTNKDVVAKASYSMIRKWTVDKMGKMMV
jgi:hypothetical protein